jgi:glycosyltransferase involved in cell wall biosynthesis
VWSPHLNSGGGARLLTQLIPPLAADQRVSALTWALAGHPPQHAQDWSPHQRLRAAPLVSARLLAWLGGDVVRRALGGSRRLQRHLMRHAAAGPVHRLQLRELQRHAGACDLIYAPWPHRLDFPSVARPVVCTIQDTILLEYPEILGGPGALRERQRTLQWLGQSASVVVSSEATRQSLQRLFGRTVVEAVLIRHAIPPRELRAKSSPPRQGLPRDYFLCLTNITSHKNLDGLLIGWSRFRSRGNYCLVLAGAGTDLLNGARTLADTQDWQEDRLLGLVQRLGLEPGRDVVGLGYVADDEIVPLIVGSHALISASLSEGGGSFPVEEALGCGVPVLCSDIPPVREHLDDRGGGGVIWFDALSVDAIVAALQTFVRHQDVYSEAARSAARVPRPDWPQVATAYIDVFEAVLSMKKPSGVPEVQGW